ncbi:MAG TPA: hypothetical protein VMV10_23850 [Pirellulales bacterium]|nr:hypothetical protein [Pirellulales bacterium]HVA45904.1 hypothetical protein [Pirellulales bacterium]
MSKEQIYGCAFGFNTERRIKPIHFASGFFLALTNRYYQLETLNKTVATSSNKEMKEDYATPGLRELLLANGCVCADFSVESVHNMRGHLQPVADNDEAVYPAFRPYSGFGNDYSLVSSRLLTNHKRNDGYAGLFVSLVLQQSDAGKRVAEMALQWLESDRSALYRLFRPLIDDEDEAESCDEKESHEIRFGELKTTRLKRVSRMMVDQTSALECLCRNLERLVAPETRLRGLTIALLIWLVQYLIREGQGKKSSPLLLMDFLGRRQSRLRSQSRWCFTRTTEDLLQSFARFDAEGRFDECHSEYEALTANSASKFPPLQEVLRELSLRSGLAQPRANNIPKHFELQPDTLRVLVLSMMPYGEVRSLAELATQLYMVWGIVIGANADDSARLASNGYAGLDQSEDLTPNVEAFVRLLKELGLAINPADGLVLCSTHSESFS